MSYPLFLRALLERGQVTVAPLGPLGREEVHQSEEILRAFEGRYRLELPGIPPPLDERAANWAGILFYRACQGYAFRDLAAELLARELSQPCPVPIDAGVHYSVDLIYRFLPDLIRLVRAASENDPLGQHLLRWAQSWPLSSVGIPNVGETSCVGFADAPSLLALYADRILASGDRSRLNDPLARQAVARALGLHPELAGALAADFPVPSLQETPS